MDEVTERRRVPGLSINRLKVELELRCATQVQAQRLEYLGPQPAQKGWASWCHIELAQFAVQPRLLAKRGAGPLSTSSHKQG